MLGNDAGMRQAIHALHTFYVQVSFVVHCALQIIMHDYIRREIFNVYYYVLLALYWRIEIELCYVDGHELSAFG